MTATWCTIHNRDFAADTDLDGNPWGCCSLCAAALMLAEEEAADDDVLRRKYEDYGYFPDGVI